MMKNYFLLLLGLISIQTMHSSESKVSDSIQKAATSIMLNSELEASKKKEQLQELGSQAIAKENFGAARVILQVFNAHGGTGLLTFDPRPFMTESAPVSGLSDKK